MNKEQELLLPAVCQWMADRLLRDNGPSQPKHSKLARKLSGRVAVARFDRRTDETWVGGGLCKHIFCPISWGQVRLQEQEMDIWRINNNMNSSYSYINRVLKQV